MQAQGKTVRRAKKLRKAMTLPEVILWRVVGHSALDGWKFRRQHPKGRYVLDFYCDALQLCVEVDGDIHGFGDQPQRDEERDAWLGRCGVTTLRIPARDVLHELDGVCELLRDRAKRRALELKLPGRDCADPAGPGPIRLAGC